MVSQQQLRSSSNVRTQSRMAQVQRKVEADARQRQVDARKAYTASVGTQAETLKRELAERAAKIVELNKRLAVGIGAGVRRVGVNYLSKKQRSRFLKERAKLTGEIKYLTEAQGIVSGGSRVDIDNFDSAAASYARTTPEYQKAKYSLKKKLSRPSYQDRKRAEAAASRPLTSFELASLKGKAIQAEKEKRVSDFISKYSTPATASTIWKSAISRASPVVERTTVQKIDDTAAKINKYVASTRVVKGYNIIKDKLLESSAVKTIQKYSSPFQNSTTIGGTIYPKRYLEERYSPEAIKLAKVLQPENILASAVYPKGPKGTQIKYAGGYKAVDDATTNTFIKFKTSGGQKGYIVGTGKVIGKSGDVSISTSQFIGKVKTKGVSSVFGGKDISAGINRPSVVSYVDDSGNVIRTVVEGSDDFVQVSGGAIKSGKKVETFQAIDFGVDTGKAIGAGGFTETSSGNLVGSKGVLANVDKLDELGTTLKSFNPSTVKGNIPSGSTIQTQKQMLDTSLKAAARAVVKPENTQLLTTYSGTPALSLGGGTVTTTKVETKAEVLPKVATLLKVESKPVVVTAAAIDVVEKPKADTVTKPRITTAPALDIAVAIKPTQTQIQQPAQIQEPLQVQTPKVTTTTSTIGKPILPLSKAISKVKEIAASRPDAFSVFGRRFGRDIKLGSFQTKEKAERKLSRFLTGTLGRSGYLKSGGERISSGLLKKQQYRKSKVDPLRVVQRRKFSLGTGEEKSEIQYFKSKSKKKKSSFSLF